MSRWNVSFHLEPHQIDVDVTVIAPDSRNAIIQATTNLPLRDDELIHSVHIGKPMPEDVIEPDDYYRLRSQSAGLQRVSSRFEGQPWGRKDGELTRRSSDGWTLKVYHIKVDGRDIVECCVIQPNGESQSFS